MRGITGIDGRWGITAVRIVFAAIVLVAGYRKMFVNGMPAVVANFTKYGLPAPAVLAYYIVILELVGGLLLLAGLFGRWLGLLYTGEFVVAAFQVKFPAEGWQGGRLDLLLIACAILFFLAGPGRAALDELWERKR
jgi:putative oxidoreductase